MSTITRVRSLLLLAMTLARARPRPWTPPVITTTEEVFRGCFLGARSSQAEDTNTNTYR